MADIITYPENGITYDADDASGYLATRQSGVYSAEEDFAVTSNGDLTVTVGAGQAWVRPARFRGRSIIMEQPETLTLPAADTLRGRIDRIVLRYDAVARKTSLLVLTGTPDSTALAAPEITRTALIYDLGLATVSRPAGSTAVTAADLNDTRADEDVCGIMRDGVTGIPTAQMLAEARARIALVEETASNSADAADKSQRAAAQNQADAEAARDAAAGSAKAAGTSETNAGQSASNAATSEVNAKASEDAAAASEQNASASEKNAAASEKNAATSEANALKYSEAAGAKAGTDKTLTVEDAPADAKAVGEALDGKSNTDHTHDLSVLINALSSGTDTPQDADYYVSQYVGGGTETTTYHRRPMSALWAYIKGKADAVFAAKSHTHNYAGSSSAGGTANSVNGFTVKSQTTDPGANSTLATGTVLLVYK